MPNFKQDWLNKRIANWTFQNWCLVSNFCSPMSNLRIFKYPKKFPTCHLQNFKLVGQLKQTMCNTFYQQVNLQSRCNNSSDYFYTTALATMEAKNPSYFIYSAVPCPATVQSPTSGCVQIYNSNKTISYAALPSQ